MNWRFVDRAKNSLWDRPSSSSKDIIWRIQFSWSINVDLQIKIIPRQLLKLYEYIIYKVYRLMIISSQATLQHRQKYLDKSSFKSMNIFEQIALVYHNCSYLAHFFFLHTSLQYIQAYGVVVWNAVILIHIPNTMHRRVGKTYGNSSTHLIVPVM